MLVRYAMTGAVATGCHYLLLVLMVEWLGFPPPIAATLGALCGALVAYAGNRRFTFASQLQHRHALPRFLVVATVGALINGAIVWIGSSLLGWHYLIAQCLATILVLFLTYGLNKYWSFREI